MRITILALLFLSLSALGNAASGSGGSPIHQEDAAARSGSGEGDILAPDAAIEKIAGDFRFTEGPAADAAGSIYFTDIPNSRILRFDPIGKVVTVLREDSGAANGLMVTPEGALLICEGGNRRLARLADGQIEVLADGFGGKKLNSPNDLAIDARGGIYFTDPRYGKRDDMEMDVEGVYYLRPSGELLRVIDDLVRPNGLVLSLDGRTLYVADNAAKTIWSYAVRKDGLLENGKKWAGMNLDARGGGDGMTIDERGNVYCAGQGCIWVWNPQGRLVTKIDVPESPANCCFGGSGGRTLFITARTSLYRIRLEVRGGRLERK